MASAPHQDGLHSRTYKSEVSDRARAAIQQRLSFETVQTNERSIKQTIQEDLSMPYAVMGL